MRRTSRRAFLTAAAVGPAVVQAVTHANQRGARGNPFARVRDIDVSLRRIPSDRFPMPFDDEEYAARLTRCREAMSKSGIQLLLVTWPDAMCYLHGYEVTWYRAYGLPTTTTAVHVDHDKVIFYGGEDPIPSAAKDRRRNAGGPTAEGQTKFLAEDLQQAGWLKQGTVVGLEYQSYLPTPQISRLYESVCVAKGAKVVDGSPIMQSIRKIKSPAEIVAMEHGARIVDLGHRAVAEAFEPGMSHAELFGIAMGAMMKAGGEWPAIPQSIIPGKPASLHLLPSRRQIQAGEVFAVDLVGVYKRYHTNVARTYIYGDPSPELVHLADASAGAFDVLSRMAKVGTPLATVGRAMREFYESKGIWQYRRTTVSYELGISFPPDFVGHSLRFNPAQESPEGEFQMNAVTQYESIFAREAGGKSLIVDDIDTFVYEAHGARRLSAIPLDLIVLG